MVMLLILTGGLYVWKTCEKKEKMETGRGRLHFSLMAQIPPSPTEPFPSFCLLLLSEFLCRRDDRCRHITGVPSSGGGYRFSRLRFRIHLAHDSGTGLQEDDRDHGGGVHCARPSQPESREDTHKVRAGSRVQPVLSWGPHCPGLGLSNSVPTASLSGQCSVNWERLKLGSMCWAHCIQQHWVCAGSSGPFCPSAVPRTFCLAFPGY